MSKKKTSRRKLSSRRCTLEKLESRWVFDGDGLEVFGAGSFTMSVAPDGTQVGFRQSRLQEVFQARFGEGVIDKVLREAIPVWIPNAAIDVGIVPDDGTPAGVLGPWRGDERFGDIRVFGFDLPDTIWASAISGNVRSVGTWAGDIVFNTAQPWSSVEQLRSAAIHELGHALGLPHNDDPLSPMHPQGPFVSNDPLASDIALLQALHGPRRPDISDTEGSNDEIDSASNIEGHDLDEDNVEEFNGSQQWIQFGDLTTAEDIDYYAIEVADDYDGRIGFAIQTKSVFHRHKAARLKLILHPDAQQLQINIIWQHAMIHGLPLADKLDQVKPVNTDSIHIFLKAIEHGVECANCGLVGGFHADSPSSSVIMALRNACKTRSTVRLLRWTRCAISCIS